MLMVTPHFYLRKPETEDLEALYRFKNDADIAGVLGGSPRFLSRQDVSEWINSHRLQRDEMLWAIADAESDSCVGHVGFYGIQHLNRSAEWGILIGERSLWGAGLGRACLDVTVRFGFDQLNLNRVELSVLTTNERARNLYLNAGFVEEGVRRQAVFRNGEYLDLACMALLRGDAKYS